MDSREANAVPPPAGWPRARGCGEREGPLPLWPRVERSRWRGASAGARELLWESGWENRGGPGLGGPRAEGAARGEPTLPVRSTPNRVASSAGGAVPLECDTGISWMGHASWSATSLDIPVCVDKR